MIYYKVKNKNKEKHGFQSHSRQTDADSVLKSIKNIDFLSSQHKAVYTKGIWRFVKDVVNIIYGDEEKRRGVSCEQNGYARVVSLVVLFN